MGRFLLYLAVFSMLFGIVLQLQAQPIINPANGHYYQVVTEDWINWHDAKVEADASTFMGMGGYLATITSQDENVFIQSILPFDASFWTGGFQPPGSPEPAGNWQWVTGEPFDYTNWAFDEPNNWFGDDPNEDRIEFYSSGEWNDLPADFELPGYVVEYRLTIDDLISVVMGLDLRKGIKNSLITKLDGAKTAAEREDRHVAVNKLNSFINEVNALSGKKLNEGQADQLIMYAEEIISAFSADAAPAKRRGIASNGKLSTVWGKIRDI